MSTRKARARDNKLVYAKETPGKGRGLFAATYFRRGDEVCTYTGAIIPTPPTLDESDPYDIEFGIGTGLTLRGDPSAIGGQLANHSCRQNAFVDSTLADTLLIRALWNIKKDEEVTLYYGSLGQFDVPCLCGEKYCAGTVGLTETGDATKHALAGVKNRNLHAIELVHRAPQSAKHDFWTRVCGGLPAEEGAWVRERLAAISAVERALGLAS